MVYTSKADQRSKRRMVPQIQTTVLLLGAVAGRERREYAISPGVIEGTVA
jgi:hypothetical protein